MLINGVRERDLVDSIRDLDSRVFVCELGGYVWVLDLT